MKNLSYFLNSKRAILRAFEDEDLSGLKTMMSDMEIMKFTGFREPQSEEKILQCLDEWKKKGHKKLGVWCAEAKDSGEFIGWFMLKDVGKEGPELGFMLAKSKWGQGFATEISSLLLDYTFHDLKFNKVHATTVSENNNSISVLKKIGMKETSTKMIGEPEYEVKCFEVARDSQLKNLEFKKIDLEKNAALCVAFRADSFLESFGTEEPFYETDPKGEVYLKWLAEKMSGVYHGVHIWYENQIIGQIEAGIRQEEDDFGYINLYYLIPEMRGKGFSKYLEEYTSNYLRSLGFDKAKLSVSPTNQRAIHFYEKNGWRDMGVRLEPGRTGRGLRFTVHYMEKDLV